MQIVMVSSGGRSRAWEIAPQHFAEDAPVRIAGEYRFLPGVPTEVGDDDAPWFLDKAQDVNRGNRSFEPAPVKGKNKVKGDGEKEDAVDKDKGMAGMGALSADEAAAAGRALSAAAAAETKPAGADPLASKGAPGGPDVQKREAVDGAAGKAPAPTARSGA